MSNSPTDSSDGVGSPRWPLIAVVLIAIVALVAALVLFAGGDDDSESAVTSDIPTTGAATDGATTSTEPAGATTQPVASTEAPIETAPDTVEPEPTDVPGTVPDEIAARDAIWPWVESPTRFADPADAAESFATDYIGFTDPVVGEFQAGDSRSGEVEVRAGDVGPWTVVFVRQLTADDSWWVLGAVSENIAVDEPEPGDVVESPLNISGSASAFEGTVDVELRADGNGEPIYVGFVTGSGAPERGPFSDTIEFTSPGTGGGALVLISRSPEDGGAVEASAMRIFFG
jgi:hypothetical protein